MSKNPKQKSEQDFLKEYEKVMKGCNPMMIPGTEQQWANPSDFFVKFSLYKEIPTGRTSSTTSYINPLSNNAQLE